MQMALTPDEQEEFWEMRAQIKSLFNVIIGDPLNRRPGFAERLNKIEDKQDGMDSKLRRLTYIFIGIGIGVLIGAAIFGYLSWQQVAEAVKLVK